MPSNSEPGLGGAVGVATYGAITSSPRDSEELSQFIDTEGWRPQHYLIVFYVAAVKAFCGCTVGTFPFILVELENEFNVGRAQVASAAGCLLFGSIIGAYIGGNMSDASGRRCTLLFASIVGSGLSLLHLLVTQLWHLCCVRFLLGIAFGNIVSCMNVYLIEFMPSSTRGWCICIAGLGWKAGAIYGVGLAWVIQNNWRLVLSGATVPGLLAVAVFCFCAPESPRWLCLNDRDTEGRQVLQRLFGKESPPKIHVSGVTGENHVADSWTVRVTKLFGPTVCLISVLCLIMWVMNVGAAYSCALWGPEILKMLLRSDKLPYAFFISMEVVAGLCQLVYAYVLDWFGRRVMLSVGWPIIAFLLTCLLGVPPVYWMLFLLFLAINLPWDLMWAAKVAYTNEAFATELRGTAAGFLTGSSRIAGAFAPVFVGLLLNHSLSAAIFAMSAMLLVAAVAAFFIPHETCQKQIKDVV